MVSTSRVSLFRLRSLRSMTWQVHTVDGESSFCFAAFRNRKTHARNSPDERGSLGRLSIQSLSQLRKPDTTNLIHSKQNNFPQRLPGWPGEDRRLLPAGNGQALRNSSGSWDLRASSVSATPGSFGAGCGSAAPGISAFPGSVGVRGWVHGSWHAPTDCRAFI